VPNITTVDPARTFWDKVATLHRLRRWWDRRGDLRGGGQRVSRHYYDVHSLLASETEEGFANDSRMAADCVQHARMFFNRPDFDLAAAVPGSYALVPHDDMLANLEQDYNAMSQMIFGEAPTFGAIIDSIVNLEKCLNGQQRQERDSGLIGRRFARISQCHFAGAIRWRLSKGAGQRSLFLRTS
jgi:Nucleotidyl transferase AbiEii toxin, Type IV TA system